MLKSASIICGGAFSLGPRSRQGIAEPPDSMASPPIRERGGISIHRRAQQRHASGQNERQVVISASDSQIPALGNTRYVVDPWPCRAEQYRYDPRFLDFLQKPTLRWSPARRPLQTPARQWRHHHGVAGSARPPRWFSALRVSGGRSAGK